MLRRRKRQTVTLDARLSFTGQGEALLVLPGTDSLVLAPDPYASDPPDSPTLDRIATELTANGRFGDLGEALLRHDDATEMVPVKVTFEVTR